MFLQFFILASLFTISIAFNCTIPPIYVDIHKRIVHGTDVFQYGAFTGVGTPGQNQSLWISLSQNETSVADVDFCKDSNLTDCKDSTRGNFDTAESPTFKQDDRHEPLDNSTDKPINSSFFGVDTFYLYTHYFESDPASQTKVENFPIELATSGDVSPGTLGLGQTSSLLSKLFGDGLISGKTFGLYVGSGMDRAGGVINGSIAFGGYDANRFVGDVHSYAMDTSHANAMNVRVKDIIIDEQGSTNTGVSLFDSTRFANTMSAPFSAQITTDQYPLSLPYDLTRNFISLLSATPSASSDNSLQIQRPFTGSLTIILEDGFNITLPPDVLLNTSTGVPLTPIKSRGENSTAPFLLSTAFLTQVYLMADYDAYTFHLARLNPSASFISDVTFCPRTKPVIYTPSKGSFWGTGLIGAVIGAVVGGIALVVLASCLFMVCMRKRASRRFEMENDFKFGPDKGGMETLEIEEVGSESSGGSTRKKGWFVGRFGKRSHAR